MKKFRVSTNTVAWVEAADQEAAVTRAREAIESVHDAVELDGPMPTVSVEDVIDVTETDTPERQWVNCYSVSSNYGGPEEGGWWYDAGNPITGASVEVTGFTDEAINDIKEAYTKRFGWQKSNRIGRHSVNGGSDFEIFVEDHPAKSFPAERPHYE